MTSLSDGIADYAREVQPQYTNQLVSLIKIPSISARETHRGDLTRVVERTADIAKDLGFTASVVDAKYPALIVTMPGDKDAGNLLIYNHLDVQPADEEEPEKPKWRTTPFEPVIDGDAIIGRGATDDKGPALSTLHAAHFLSKNNIPRPTIQFLYETAEEIGSQHFGQILDGLVAKGSLQTPDSILISDSEFEGNNPALTYKLRGMVRGTMTLELGSREWHSGTLGGAARNPIDVLYRAAFTCRDENGLMIIPGFDEDIIPLTSGEISALNELVSHCDLDKIKRDLGAYELNTADPREFYMRTSHSPTFELHGTEGTQHLAGEIKSSIPCKVSLKYSMRLVPGQDWKDLQEKLQRHVVKTHPNIVVRNLGDGVNAAITPLESPFMDKAAEACYVGFGIPALRTAAGGSIGSVPEFQRVFGVPVVMIAQSLLSDGYHAPNEEFRYSQAAKGMATMAHYIHNIAGIKSNRV
jgi:acetylornithine deacetylase/succinyl-diaminopimelate desuccinylase-like protein